MVSIHGLEYQEREWCEGFLSSLRRGTVAGIVDRIPPAWGVPDAGRAALVEQIVRRAAFVATRIHNGWPLDGRTDSPVAATPNP
ncbi:hypothetical protein [Gemmata obscuriglobus]|uniref:Uncharacterized protein n=1 Tax=Gemmata obscuriglobus TaxID=114 RepID=A0A2Z3HFG2_9BACT|nr:hypothetical protein [Gemmata obscuriglobus]AWM40524.1 hypothetical protein C1280_28420 [Gemmata obscuriglobus]